MPESVGKTLKKFRESKNLSIEEVSERTRTPKKILSAIEEDRAYEIASPFYAKGFVKSYSKFLDALEEKAVKEYLSGGQKKEEIVSTPKPPRTVAEWEWFQKHKRRIGFGMLVIFGIWVAFSSFAQLKKFVKARNVAAVSRAAKESASQTQLDSKYLTEQGAIATDSEKKEDFELEIIAHYNTWIQVSSNGELLFKGILEKGSKDKWRSKKDIELSLGNAGGVMLKLNGEDLGSPGRRGEKKSIVVTKDGII